MSWNSFARELHNELCESLSCQEYIGDDSTGYYEHNLRREFWEPLAEDVKRYVVARVHEGKGFPDASHAWPHCELCDAAVDDPEAADPCERAEPPVDATPPGTFTFVDVPVVNGTAVLPNGSTVHSSQNVIRVAVPSR